MWIYIHKIIRHINMYLYVHTKYMPIWLSKCFPG